MCFKFINTILMRRLHSHHLAAFEVMLTTELMLMDDIDR